jgi:hypothetical protein
MIIAGAAIHGRMTIGEDDIVTLAGDDVGLAIDTDHIVARAGIDRGVAGLNVNAVVTGSADNLEKVQAGGRPGITDTDTDDDAVLAAPSPLVPAPAAAVLVWEIDQVV